MKIAVIGQSLFGQEVYKQLRKEGHEVVGVFTIPDKDGKADPLGECRTGHRKGCVWVAELKVPPNSVYGLSSIRLGCLDLGQSLPSSLWNAVVYVVVLLPTSLNSAPRRAWSVSSFMGPGKV